MKTTDNFYLDPQTVLDGAKRQNPSAALVVTMDEHGGISVYGSHSTPIMMNMASAARPHIISLRDKPEDSE